MRHYKSIEQLDTDLEILKLRKEIGEEKIKLHLSQLREETAPRNLLKSALAELSNKISLDTLLQFIDKRRHR